MSTFKNDVLAGLSAQPKSLPCKWFYDEQGSLLFEKICQTAEYYLTRVETQLLKESARDVARRVGPQVDVLEPGSGAGEKVQILLNALDNPHCFIPIDISASAVESSADSLRQLYPDLKIVPIVADFTQSIQLPDEFGGSGEKKLIFFPGSTISNFNRPEAVEFLTTLRSLLSPGDFMLIGVDLRKDSKILEKAYDDVQGVTAAFNLNLLQRIVRELETDLNPENFRHRAHFNEFESRIEMHLESCLEQTFRVEGQEFYFKEGETIHTENSYKFRIDDFLKIAEQASLKRVEVYLDEKQYVSLLLLEATESKA